MTGRLGTCTPSDTHQNRHALALAHDIRRGSLTAPAPRFDDLLDHARDLETWDAATNAEQDACALEVADRCWLTWLGCRVYEALSRAQCNAACDPGAGCGLPLSRRVAVFRHEATGMELVLVPGERCVSCLSGKPPPDFSHCLPPFLLGWWPVTIHDWNQASTAEEYEQAGHGHLPITGRSHQEVLDWFEDDGGHGHPLGLRLPTATEWRHAAAAGTNTRFWWGDEMDGRYCWHAGNSGWEPTIEEGRVTVGTTGAFDARLRPVTEHEEAGAWNPLGLVDVWGNCDEWLADGRVIGGCFADRVSSGARNYASGTTVGIGFRAAMTIPERQS